MTESFELERNGLVVDEPVFCFFFGGGLECVGGALKGTIDLMRG